MTIGDLVRYNLDQHQNDVPGLVVGYHHPLSDGTQYLHVQWFDWGAGEIAVENPRALVLVSKANEAW